MITFARTIVVLYLMAFVLLGCASTQRHETSVEISGEEAVQMIEAGDVRTVFEPHNGPPTIQLRDGQRFYVDSKYDLILNMEKHGLMDRVENIYMEQTLHSAWRPAVAHTLNGHLWPKAATQVINSPTATDPNLPVGVIRSYRARNHGFDIVIEYMLEVFREYYVVLLIELVILTPLYVEQELVSRRVLLVFFAALVSFVACMFLYGFTDTQQLRWVAGETVLFVMPIIFAAISVGAAVAMCQRQNRSYGTKIAVGLAAGLVAVAVGPAIFWYVGFIIGGDY